jgi:acetylornithine/N-succinyldiaminopimelate aminotransferase
MNDWKHIEDTFEVKTYARYPVVFESGEDIYLFDTDGKKYTDLYGGHCVSILGHSPTKVAEALYEQSKELMFYSNVVYHPSRAKASKKLVEMSPSGFDRVFFCNSGTEANENAIKIAWLVTGKQQIVSTIGGWHGRTLASLSVTHSPKLRNPFQFALPVSSFIPFGDADALENLLTNNTDVAAFIIEPIQSISGCAMAEDSYYRRIREICSKHGVMLIFDEIQTGVGRTGKFSFCEHVDMAPDIITLAKSLGAGFPIGAVLIPESISQKINIGDLGSTFAGGMMASAACLATLNEIESRNLMTHASVLFDTLNATLKGSEVKIRGKGCLIGLELPCPAKPVVEKLFKLGWITGTSDVENVMRIMPPLITPAEVIQNFAKILLGVVESELN